MNLSVEANERLYDALAEAIDRAGPEHQALFLTKLSILLANHLGDETVIDQAIAKALLQIR